MMIHGCEGRPADEERRGVVAPQRVEYHSYLGPVADISEGYPLQRCAVDDESVETPLHPFAVGGVVRGHMFG